MANTFKNEAEVRANVKQFTNQVANNASQQKELFATLMKDLETNALGVEGMEPLGALLNLSEENFAFVAPLFLSELDKSFDNMNDRMALVQSLNAGGQTVEDLREQYDDILIQIDTQTTGLLSKQKRDFIHQLLDIVYNAVAATEGIASRYIRIPIEYCNDKARTPAYAHPTDSGMDVYALEDITIAPGETKLVPLGIKVAIPAGYELQVRPKSGRCLKTKLRIANAPGTIDSGYRDELAVIVDNIEAPIKNITGIIKEFANEGEAYSDKWVPVCEYGSSYTIGEGEKFAQLVLTAVPKVIWSEVSSVGNIGEDRHGGFGSTSIYSEEDKRYGTDLV